MSKPETIMIDADYLRVMLLFAGYGDFRNYLNGVAIQGQYMIATNGHILAACKLEKNSGIDAIIPTMEISTALAFNKKKHLRKNVTETIELTASRIGNINYVPIEGKFPDWRRVIPKEVRLSKEGKMTFNSKYLSILNKVCKLTGKNSNYAICFTQSETDGVAIIHTNNKDFVFVMTPILIDGLKDLTLPEWVKKC